MKKEFVLFPMILVISVNLVACGSGQIFGPTVTPTWTNTASPTLTMTPTITPTLTSTPTQTPIPLPGTISGVIYIPQIKMPWVTSVELYTATTEVGDLVTKVNTDKKGHYVFESIVPGTYRVVVWWIRNYVDLFPYKNPICGFSESSTSWSPHMELDKTKPGFNVPNEYFYSSELLITNGEDLVPDMNITCSEFN